LGLANDLIMCVMNRGSDGYKIEIVDTIGAIQTSIDPKKKPTII